MCPSRKRTYSIMSNPAFGAITIQKGRFIVQLPQAAINQKTAEIKKFVQRKLDKLEQLTLADLMHLQEKYNVEVTIK